MNFLAVFVGGGLGAFVRYLLSLITPHSSYLPLATLIANFLGCFIATVVFVYFTMKTGLNSGYKIFLITGFCGGLSTLSAFSLEVLNYVQADDYVKAGIYILLTCLVCTVSVLLGLWIVKSSLS